MHEITERTVTPSGKVLLPGRCTDAEAAFHGLTNPVVHVETHIAIDGEAVAEHLDEPLDAED